MLEENKLLYEEAEILVVDGTTNETAGRKLAERSQAQRRYLDVLNAGCPVCDKAIKPTGDGRFSCQTCQKLVSFSLIKLNSKEIEVNLSGIDRRIFLENQSVEAEIHIVFCHVGVEFEVILQVPMKCLSCGEPMRQRVFFLKLLSGSDAREVVYCSSNCGIRTYLRTGVDGERIYIEPNIERVVEPVNDPFEIAVVDGLPDRPPTDLPSVESAPEETNIADTVVVSETTPTESAQSAINVVDNDSETKAEAPANKRKNVGKQILRVLRVNGTPMQRKEIQKQVDGNVVKPLTKLVKEGLVVQPKRGYYSLP